MELEGHDYNYNLYSHEFSEIPIFEYFECLKIEVDVYFDADSEKMHPRGVILTNLISEKLPVVVT